MEHSQTIDFVGITFFGHVILKRHDCFISRLEVLLLLRQYELLFESIGSEHSCHNKENYIEKYVS